MADEQKPEEDLRISSYQHTLIGWIFEKCNLLNLDGLLRVWAVELIMLGLWGVVFLAAMVDRVAWHPFKGLSWPLNCRVISSYDNSHKTMASCTSKVSRPPMWMVLLPHSPIVSMDEFYYAEMVNSLVASDADLNQGVLEIHRASNNKYVAEIDYTARLRKLQSEGQGVIGKCREQSLIPASDDAVASIPDGVYWIALYVNGVRCSNKASFALDAESDESDEPALRLIPLEMGPHQTVPYVGVRGIGPCQEDPMFTNRAVVYPELIINRISREPKIRVWTGPEKMLRSMQQQVSILDLGNYEPFNESEPLDEIQIKVGDYKSALCGLELPMVYDIPLFCNLFGALPLYLFCLSFFDIEANRFLRWVVREKRIAITPDDLQKNIVDKLQRYYRSKWIGLFSLLLAIAALSSWVVPEFTNQQWGWVSRVTDGTWEIPTFAGCLTIVYLIGINYTLLSCIFKFLGWMWLLFRLSQFPFRVDPIHPDSCGGFAPLNLVQKVVGYLVCGAGITIVSIIFNNYIFLKVPFFRADHMVMIIAFVIMAPILFAFPLCFFWEKLWWARKEKITWVDTLSNDIIIAINELLKHTDRTDHEKMLEAAAKLETVDFTGSYRERILSMRALPFDFKTFRSFLALAYSPFLSLIIPLFPETIQKIVNLFF